MRMKLLKNKKMYIINALTCVLIFLLILAIKRTSPFGNYMLGTSDAPVQFKPMLYSLITNIKTGTLLNYTFNNGLGNATIFNFLYYIASPLNLIALMFKSPDMMYLSATFIKIIIATLSLTFYTKKNQIEYSYYNDNHMIGTINVDKEQIIFTSIPYDKDWIVKVDGKEVKPIVVLDSLM